MNVTSSLSSISALLPVAWQPYTLWIVIGVAVVLVIAFGRLISIFMRLSFVFRMLLMLGSVGAFAGLHGCTATTNGNASSFSSGGFGR